MENIIVIKDLVKNFGNSSIALDGVSLNIEKGKFVAIMGPSGSGKSTLLNIIGLLDTQTSGKIYIDDKEVSGNTEEELSYMRMKSVGFVFQGFYLNPRLTAIENVMVPMHINDYYRSVNKKETALRLLAEFNMNDYATRYPNELSGGEQQRVCIARSLANDPDIILADEPTGNLDEENEKIIFTYLKKLSKQGKTVIVVSHNDAVKDYADEVINIVKGKIKE